jgi:hypothetical protein
MKRLYLTGAYLALFYVACFAIEQFEPQIGEPCSEDTTAYKSGTIGATIGI